jgi:hypothetical protein
VWLGPRRIYHDEIAFVMQRFDRWQQRAVLIGSWRARLEEELQGELDRAHCRQCQREE